jgi:hypothetical protein
VALDQQTDQVWACVESRSTVFSCPVHSGTAPPPEPWRMPRNLFPRAVMAAGRAGPRELR